jgi:excisionase family DNA binding protein
VDEPLLTPEQVAEILAVKPQTVRDAVWRGKLPCIRLWSGRKRSLIRFRRSEIEAFLRTRTTSTAITE